MSKEPVCAYCEKPGKLHRDHVVPRSRGGPDNANNIVMACQSCNSAKGDQLPSEWLGDRAPQPVLLIESRVSAKLKAVFKRRDPKGKADAPELGFALTFNEKGQVEYVAEVISEAAASVRVNPVNILNLWCGFWDPSGEMVDVPRERCRLFLDRDSCLAAYEKTVNRQERERERAD